MGLAVAIFIVEGFIVYRLGFASGVITGAYSALASIKAVLGPEEYKALDVKIQEKLVALASKNKQV